VHAREELMAREEALRAWFSREPCLLKVEEERGGAYLGPSKREAKASKDSGREISTVFGEWIET
jgi:hypothetical protein